MGFLNVPGVGFADKLTKILFGDDAEVAVQELAAVFFDAITGSSGLDITLHTAEPIKDDGVSANEVDGGSYSSKSIEFTLTDNIAKNTAAIEWTNMPETTVSHALILRRISGSSAVPIQVIEFTTPRSLQAGDGFNIPIEGIQITIEEETEILPT